MAATPALGLPYPIGTDRVADGDNAMQALAERTELKLPRGLLAVVFRNVNQAGITAQVDVTGMTLTFDVTANRRIRLRAYIPYAISTVASDILNVKIQEGAVVLQTAYVPIPAAVGFPSAPLQPDIVLLAPATGTHTYKLTTQRQNGTGSVTIGATAAEQMMFTAEDIGSNV